MRARLAEIAPEVEAVSREPEKGEDVPIDLRNSNAVNPFEFVTTLYGRPAYWERDPTPLLAPFFIIFFGLCVSDPTSGFQAMNRAVLELYAGDAFPSDYPDVDVLLAAHREGLRVGERSVTMAQSVRASSLHSGWAPIYYVYKMMLSVWAASAGWARPPR